MNFEWMKDLNLLAYVLGSSLGVTFIIGVLLGTKKVDKERIVYTFKHRYDRAFNYLFNAMMVFVLLMAVKFFMDGNWSNYRPWLVLSYWLSLVFIICYVMTRRVIVTKDGVGYMDMFGRNGNIFYPWAKIKQYELEEKNVVFKENDKVKTLALKISLSSKDLDEANKIIKLAMNNKKKGH